VDVSDKLPPELERFWRTDDGMTACQRAETYGIDLSMLGENLRLTPSERMARNDAALDLGKSLSAAMKHART